MRELFESEKRTISTLGKDEWGVDLLTNVHPVVEEHIECTSRERPLFNLDFRLHFADDPAPAGSLSTVRCALPNAMGGADVFLAVDKECRRPLSLQMILGDAYPPRFFKRYIRHVECVLRSDAIRRTTEDAGIDRTTCDRAFRIRNSQYCRFLVIGTDICFLWFTVNERPAQYGRRLTLMSDESLGQVFCRVDGRHIVAVDGWVSASGMELGDKT